MELYPRLRFPMATMSSPLPRQTIAAPAGSPSPLPLISTRSRRCWKTAVSDVGDRLTGATEAGSTVVIKDSQGNTLGSGTAGGDGTFSIGISPAKINGETLSISVTDKAANSGPVET